MTSSSRLDGIFTALVTPFLENGEIDWPAFDALLDRQLAAGIAGLVPVGTTGEAATLSEKEALAVISHTVKRANGKAYVLAGTGSNSTTKTINSTKQAADAGVDGVLLVTPYYNKPSQQGLMAHYEAVADCALVDNVLYSVPGRAGIAIDAITAGRLSKSRNNIIAIKEAGGDPARVTQLHRECGDDFIIHCGDDGLALPFYALGARGLTSVLSNYDPEICVALYHAWKSGDTERARTLHELIAPLAKALFIDSSPSPVKRALSLHGYMSDQVRLPLVKFNSSQEGILKEATKYLDEHRGDFVS